MCIVRFVLAVLLVCVPAAAQVAPPVDWITTWGSSPVAPLPDQKNNHGFHNQTVRMIVHSSVGGSEVRVRLSNVFGIDPLSIGEAHIALRGAGPNIVPGTDRALTFAGLRSVTVPPGGSVTSDSVVLDLPAFSDLAVSVFLPQNTGQATFHPFAACTNYIRAGNAAAIANWGAIVGEPLPGAEPDSWFYLTDVEVKIPRKNAAIIAFGDSITDGVRSTLNANHRWPNFLAERLTGAGRAVVDEGISGNGILSEITGPSGLSRFERDVLQQAGAKYVIVLLGINDIGQSARHPVTAGAITAAYQELIARAHQRGLKIYGGTLTPIGGSGYDSPEHQAMRQAVNDFIRRSGAYDGVIDFDAAVRDPDNPLRFKPEYNSGDSLHPSDAGYQAMAKSIDLHFFQGDAEPSPIDPNGEPPGTGAGAVERYSVWHDDNGWHVRAMTAGNEHHFRGAIAASDGSFVDVAGFNPPGSGPQHDLFVPSPDNKTINFDFATKGGIVGVDFRVSGEKPSLSFMLELDEKNPKFDPSRIFIGKAGAHPDVNPFLLPAHPGEKIAGEAAERAIASWRALKQSFSAPNQPGLFLGNVGSTELAAVWGHSQIAHGALYVALLAGDHADFDLTLQGLARYKLVNQYTGYAPTVNPASNANRFWDDNGVTALMLLQAYHQMPNPQQYLQMVMELWPFFKSGQGTDGGVYWHELDRARHRGLSATGSDDEVALQLYVASNKSDQQFKMFAQKNHDWLESHLRDAQQQLYWNSWSDQANQRPAWCKAQVPAFPEPPPEVCQTIFTYNQGFVIGTDVLLYRINKDSAYLTHAAKIADATLDFYTPDRLWKEAAPFVSIFFRNLLVLDHYAPNPRYRRALDAYMNRVWNEARDPQTGLFTRGGVGIYDSQHGYGSIDQAAFVQMFALLAWPQDRLPD